MHVLLVINNLSPGTGPFQRIIKFDKSVIVSVVSLFDNQIKLKKVSTQFGVEISHVNLFGLSSNNKLEAFVSLYKLVKKIKPNIIQSAHTFSTIICTLIKTLTRIPVISFEGTLINRWSFYKKYLILFIHALSDVVVCVSNNTKIENSNINLILSKMTNRRTIYNGVDIGLIDSINNNLSGSGNIVTIGYTGDLKSVKNLGILFHAFSECYKHNTNIRLKSLGITSTRDLKVTGISTVGKTVFLSGQNPNMGTFVIRFNICLRLRCLGWTLNAIGFITSFRRFICKFYLLSTPSEA